MKITFSLILFILGINQFAQAEDFADACTRAYDEGNPANIFDYCSKGALEGDGRSTYILGNLYFEGLAGVERDIEKGAENWFKAANLDVRDAQHNVGRLYQKGIVVEQDYEQALSWYTKAANQGDVYAMHNIGFFHQKGHGVPVNFKLAESWYTKSAELGLQNSQYNLAIMYFNGEELPKDLIKSYAWMHLANEKGFTPARNDIFAMEDYLSESEKKIAITLSATLIKK